MDRRTPAPEPVAPFPGAPSRLLTRTQTAWWLGVTEATVDRMRRDGRLSAVRVGGRVMFDRDTLGALVASGRVATPKDRG